MAAGERVTVPTVPEEKFAVLVAKGSSQADAYRKAFPRSNRWKDSSVWSRASTLAARERVAKRIVELRESANMKNMISVDRVLQERARLAFYDPRKFFREDGSLKMPHELDDDTAAALAGLEVVEMAGGMKIAVHPADGDEDSEGTVQHIPMYTKKLKMADKDKSLMALEKHLGMYKEDDNCHALLNITINLGDSSDKERVVSEQ